MKRTYIYFLIPLVGMAVFGAYYWNFTQNYDEREAAKAAEEQRIRDVERENEASLRQKAVDDAFAQQQKRKIEREAKAALERKQEDDKEAAEVARDHAKSEVRRLEEKVRSLTRDIQEAQDDLDKFNLEKAALQAEQTAIAGGVAASEANTKRLTEVLERISAADAAVEAAAEAAAKAAAEKKE
jgi:colicin import membrane protein